MATGISLISSGFTLIDENWGGIYRGGSYIILGPRKSGRTLLGLQMAAEAAKASEICLYFTNMRPKDLMIQAASLNFDIQSSMNKNLIVVVRVAPPNEIYDVPNPDDYLIEYLNDIVTVVNQYNPSRIIFDELTPYIGFQSLDLLHRAFLHTLETVEDRNITSFFVVGEPATQKAQQIIEVVAQAVTATIHLKKQAEKIQDRYHGGTVIISPNVGHTEGQFSAKYIIEPYKGVSTVVPEPEKQMISVQPEQGMPQTQGGASPNMQPLSGEMPPATPSAPVSSPQAPAAAPQNSDMNFSNVYNLNDFQLILNNQIALFKSTGQTFNLVTFKLDPASQVKGLLSLNQLQNALSVSVQKKDKICVVDNKIIVLLVRSTPNSLPELLAKLRNGLPSSDESYFKAVTEYISLQNNEVAEAFNNAEDMINPILQESGSVPYQPVTDYLI